MAQSIVIYNSRRGSTEQYAAWIAEELECRAIPLGELLKDPGINLYEYDCIIFGGWIRGSGIVDFDKFGNLLDAELLSRLIVFGVGFADETPENYMQVWSFSIGKLDPHNENGAILYILGGRYDPSAVSGADKIMMKIMRTVLLSGSTPEAKLQANKIRDRIDNGVDMVSRDNITSLVKDARKKIAVHESPVQQ